MRPPAGWRSRASPARFPTPPNVIPPTRRYHLTADGLRRLAWEEGLQLDGLLRACPISPQWRHVLLERLDAVAAIYRLAATVAGLAHPIRFRWYRAGPLDVAIALPGGRIVGILRQGVTSDRTAFAKRLWRLRESPPLSAYLLLTPNAVRLRHTRQLAAGMPAIAFLALASDTVSGMADAPGWRTAAGAVLLDLRTALSHARPHASGPAAERSAHAALPVELSLSDPHPAMPVGRCRSCSGLSRSAPSTCSPGRTWIVPNHLGALLGVNRSRLSHVLQRLEALGLTAHADVDGRSRLALSDRVPPWERQGSAGAGRS